LEALIKHIITAFITASLFMSVAFAPAPALAWTPKSFVYTQNNSDAYVWITVYGASSGVLAAFPQAATVIGQALTKSQLRGTIQGSWCVAPGALDKHGLSTQIYSVRAEVMSPAAKHCAHPVVLDSIHAFGGDWPDPDGAPRVGSYNKSTPEAQIHPGLLHVIGSKGAYSLTESRAVAH
jgi:hypothetical protein